MSAQVYKSKVLRLHGAEQITNSNDTKNIYSSRCTQVVKVPQIQKDLQRKTRRYHRTLLSISAIKTRPWKILHDDSGKWDTVSLSQKVKNMI